jgi:hypothetical protein
LTNGFKKYRKDRLGGVLVTMDKRLEKAFLAHGRARLI